MAAGNRDDMIMGDLEEEQFTIQQQDLIMLHEFIPLWIDPLNEQHQCLVQDISEELCIHDPLKDADSSFANPGPHMDFRGVLRRTIGMDE